jgi:hypothetical protein
MFAEARGGEQGFRGIQNPTDFFAHRIRQVRH